MCVLVVWVSWCSVFGCMLCLLLFIICRCCCSICVVCSRLGYISGLYSIVLFVLVRVSSNVDNVVCVFLVIISCVGLY